MQFLPLYSSLEEAAVACQVCRACQRSGSRTQVVFGSGNPAARLMLIGEAPSSTDDSTGKPFTGPAGKVLDAALAYAGISRHDVWITNLVRCYAGRQRDGRTENRPATTSEINACRTWTSIEIQMVKPAVILAVGAPAAREVIRPDFRLTEERGRAISRADGRQVIATIQPAYVMRLVNLVDRQASEEARQIFFDDVALAVRLSREDAG